ncbi:hypothetical protein DACRYDRAFT_18278 [Dacryopinax primogenitus]|uniref:Uncharacterized protein n=1 Tax=Dacryopinax primogenitus (strain DJM 731) TaxID=1858805 RepID=M5FRE8_DACPD|nr:uncharacterized protein DACRYDRAFT_18278 [Dacryopinax primogenitus]EJT98228.1 hypothetical protein DACRYDRAFT_18278 [Dacryopinax primogenitus]
MSNTDGNNSFQLLQQIFETSTASLKFYCKCALVSKESMSSEGSSALAVLAKKKEKGKNCVANIRTEIVDRGDLEALGMANPPDEDKIWFSNADCKRRGNSAFDKELKKERETQIDLCYGTDAEFEAKRVQVGQVGEYAGQVKAAQKKARLSAEEREGLCIMCKALIDAKYKANAGRTFKEDMGEQLQKTFKQKVLGARVCFAFKHKKVKHGLLDSLLLAWMSVKEGG